MTQLYTSFASLQMLTQPLTFPSLPPLLPARVKVLETSQDNRVLRIDYNQVKDAIYVTGLHHAPVPTLLEANPSRSPSKGYISVYCMSVKYDTTPKRIQVLHTHTLRVTGPEIPLTHSLSPKRIPYLSI